MNEVIIELSNFNKKKFGARVAELLIHNEQLFYLHQVEDNLIDFSL